MKPPRPFTRRGVTYRPVAVAMYGDLTNLEPLARVVGDDGELWDGHLVLWAADPAGSGDRACR